MSSGSIKAKGKRQAHRDARLVVEVDPNQLALFRAEMLAELRPEQRESEALADIAKAWLPLKTAGMKSATDFEGRVLNHLVPSIGQHTDRTLLPMHVRAMMNELLAQGLSLQTVRHVWDAGRQCINHARKNKLWHGDNPFAEEKPDPVPAADYDSLSAEEAGRVLLAVESFWRPLFAAKLYLGPRRSELFRLLKTDVDLLADTIRLTITKTVRRRPTLRTSIVPIPDEFRPFLVEALQRPGEHLFTALDGARLTKDTKLCDVLRRALARVGLGERRLTFHALRRVCSTNHQEAGCHPWVVSHALGHSQAAVVLAENTTARRYTRFSQDFIRKELNRMTLFPRGRPEGGIDGTQHSRGNTVLETSDTSACSSDWIEHRPSKPLRPGSGGAEQDPATASSLVAFFLARLGQRFWAKVRRGPPEACWLWEGTSSSRDHYGQLRVEGRYVAAHRIAFELSGRRLEPGKVIRHRCDTRLCVNPGHLEQGTHEENRRDCVDRGRHAIGEQNGRAKLGETDVRSVRRLLAKGWGPNRIARRFGVDPKAIRQIRDGKTWRHVGGVQ